jgi:hypothetical protein
MGSFLSFPSSAKRMLKAQTIATVKNNVRHPKINLFIITLLVL